MSEIVTYPVLKVFNINVYNGVTDPETNNTIKLYCGGFNAQSDFSGHDFRDGLSYSIKETVIDGKTYKTCYYIGVGNIDSDKIAFVVSRESVGNKHATVLNNVIPENSTYSLLTLCDSKGNLSKNHFSATSGGNSTGVTPYMGKYYIGTTFIDGFEIGKSAYLSNTNDNESYICGMNFDGTEYFGWVLLQKETNGKYSVFASFVSANYWENAEVAPFGNTTPGGTIGGYGTYDDTSDTYPTPPNILNDTYKSIFGTGAGLSVYALSNADYHTFLTNIYNPAFFQTWENTIFNPTNGIYSCIRVPFTQTNLTLENVSTLSISHTNFAMTTHRITNGFVYDEQIDDGHTEIYNVNEYFGSYLDYAPYTTAELIIPFYGSISLDINEIMGGTVKITRRCNYLNGDFTVFVQCTNRFGISNTHTYSGNAAFTLPIISGDTGMLNRMLDGVASVVNGLAGNVGGAISKTWDALNEGGNVQESQRFSGGAGWMATRNFYLIIRRVCQSNPENYTKENGRQADEFVKFSDLQGYTEVSAVDLKFTNGKITSAEIDEINNLLKQGVFF